MANFDPSRSGIHPSVPPPRKPALAKCSPERYSLGNAIAAAFRAWCRARNISVRDLAAILGLNKANAEKKLSGESPLSEVDLGMFPERFESELRLELAIATRVHRSQSQLRAHG